jgi:hemerythrin-like domain-containing protein
MRAGLPNCAAVAHDSHVQKIVWPSCQMSDGLEGLYADHANMKALLRLLESELIRYRENGKADFELLQSMMDDVILFQNLFHHPKEDLVFARLMVRHQASAEAVLSVFTEHAKLAVVTHRFAMALRAVGAGAELPRGWFEELWSDYVSFVRGHMEAEEKDLFPRAADRLTNLDWQEVDALVEKLKGPHIAKTLAEAEQWLDYQNPATPDPKSSTD